MKKLLLIGMAAMLLTTAAFAVSTGQGPTGLVCVPTAETVKAGDIDLAADLFYAPMYFAHSGSTSSHKKLANAYPVRLEYGVINGLEVGATYQFQNNTSGVGGGDWYGINAKYVIPYHPAKVDFAVGAQYINFADYPVGDVKGARMTDDNVYLAATRDLYSNSSVKLIGDLGLTFDKLNNWWTGYSPSVLRPMVGAVVVLPTLHKLAICADFIPKDSAAPVPDLTAKVPGTAAKSANTFSLAALYPINKMIAIDAGFTTGTPLANSAMSKVNTLVGIKLSFSTK